MWICGLCFDVMCVYMCVRVCICVCTGKGEEIKLELHNHVPVATALRCGSISECIVL